LGLKGWVYGGHYRQERYLYTLQRITGLGLVLYTLLHLCMNGFRLGGERAWTGLMAAFESPIIGMLEYFVLAAFIIHALNGVRLLLQQLGFLLGRPKPPVYPYVDSLQKKRFIVRGMVGLMGILLVIILIDFLV
jgi:succinate dehydrogenase / fumarate reductase cytochrome b subunit